MIEDRTESEAKSETDQIFDPLNNSRSINQDNRQPSQQDIRQKETTMHKQEEDLDQEKEDEE